MGIAPVAVAAGILVGVYALVVRDRQRIAVFCGKVAFLLALGFGALMTLFLAGEAMTDPGGSQGALITLGWSLPLVGVSIWAWLSPRTYEPYAWASTGVVVAMAAWWAAAPAIATEWMDSTGPILPVAALVAAVPMALWGRAAPGRASIALLVTTIAPILSAGLAGGFGLLSATTSVSAIVGPLTVCGMLFAARALLARGAAVPVRGTSPTLTT